MMTRINTLLLISLIAVLAACKKDNNLKGPADLAGTWKAIGGYISSGGPQYFVKATKTSFVEFKPDGKLGGTYFGDYKYYRVTDSVTIKLTKTDTTQYQNYFYRIRKDSLSMSPSGPIICIEGCSTIFVKQD